MRLFYAFLIALALTGIAVTVIGRTVDGINARIAIGQQSAIGQ